jgi:hypothetical protein
MIISTKIKLGKEFGHYLLRHISHIHEEKDCTYSLNGYKYSSYILITIRTQSSKWQHIHFRYKAPGPYSKGLLEHLSNSVIL